jgi:hypothetical protein
LLSTAISRALIFLSGCFNNARDEEAWIIVGDNGAGFFSQSFKQTLAGSGFGFDIGEIPNPGGGQRGLVVGHAVKDEAVKPVGGVRVSGSQGLENQQRPVHFNGQMRGVLEGEIVFSAPEGGHPVQNVGTTGVYGGVVQVADSIWRGGFHNCAVYQRIRALAQVSPPPKAVRQTHCPGLRASDRAAWSKAMATEAEDTLP